MSEAIDHSTIDFNVFLAKPAIQLQLLREIMIDLLQGTGSNPDQGPQAILLQLATALQQQRQFFKICDLLRML